MSYSEDLARWTEQLRFEDLPDSVVRHTKFRMLDVVGLVLAGRGTAFGTSVCRAMSTLHPCGRSHILGSGVGTSVIGAAFANGSLSQALEFDDTHNKSVVHMSSPAVAAAVAISETIPMSGRSLITSVALGNEISCRIGSIAPQQFHKRGFHPTALFATLGVTYLSGKMYGLDVGQLRDAAGIAGSFASGLLECWVDGTQSKFLHPGSAAQSGINAAMLALCGTTGPEQVIEGRWGLINSHLQSSEVPRDYEQLVGGLGSRWESENASFKPFPVAHVIHPYIDALLRLREQYNLRAADIVEIVCPIAEYQIGIVCEPLSEKYFPRSDSQGRISLQFTLAEAMVAGRIDRHSYSNRALINPEIRALAQRIRYQVDPSFPGPERFKGSVRVTLRDGRTVGSDEENNRGSLLNPMTEEDIIAKFSDNVSEELSALEGRRVIDFILNLEDQDEAATLVGLTVGGHTSSKSEMGSAIRVPPLP